MTEYTPDWAEVASLVKQRVDQKCENCGHHNDPPHGYTLTVHHIDHNSLNNAPLNLVALCQRCHLHYQHYQDYHQLSFFRLPQWILRYLEGKQSLQE